MNANITQIKEISKIYPSLSDISCIEDSDDSDLLFISGQLRRLNTSTSCPVLVFNPISSKFIGTSQYLVTKKMIQTRNDRWITTLKKFTFNKIKILGVGGNSRVLDFYQITKETNKKIGLMILRTNFFRDESFSFF